MAQKTKTITTVLFEAEDSDNSLQFELNTDGTVDVVLFDGDEVACATTLDVDAMIRKFKTERGLLI